MARIPDDELERIKRETDLVALVQVVLDRGLSERATRDRGGRAM